MQGGGGRAPPDNVEESYRDPHTIARGYQLEALEKAKKENTIVFLETGSGKTLIAVMLLKSYAHMIRKPSQHIAVFLAPAVHLVSQQADVLEMHTDLKVGRFWGEMGVDFWSESTWNQKLQEFEEYYHPQLCLNSGNLPRILGMTASLVNDKGSSSQIAYKKKISEIETLLNSKVYTVDNESVLAQYVPFPTPKIKFYKHVDASFDQYSHLAYNLKLLKLKYSRALQELGLDGLNEEGAKRRISKLHGTFSYCLSELGIWMTIKAAEALSCRENDIFFWGEDKDHITDRIVREFSKDVFKDFSKHMPSEWLVGRDLEADLDAGFLSSKIECLVRSLIEYGGVKDLRCIIFVERVITAIVLQSLLSQVQELLHWKTKYTAGNHSGLQCQSRREQINIVDAFREGKVNIIVATQILEEGLDVQSCNLVIRFDPSTSVCSFIQSRGRARMQGSDYILIVKSGDSSTLSRVMNYLASGDIMRKESLGQASLPCAPLDNQMSDEECYCVESTGAIVTLSSSVLEALTTKKCQEAFSLESLETLGDSFLKYAASQQLFRSYPYHHEGLLSAKKDQMVFNIALYKMGCERELPGYIRREPFDPKNWSIPGEYLGCIGDNIVIFSKAKNIYNKGTKYIKYKVVSDVAEALIGAYLSTGGEVAALYFLKWLGIEVDFSNKVPDDASFLARPETYININFLESLLNYSFHNPCLLVEALTHGSYLVQDIPKCYQRLEFLGDAALDYLMTVHLYNKYPGLSPGLLTDLRSASVNNSCYAHAAVKVLGDVIESLAGAILVDSGYDKDVVWKSIRPLLEPLVSPDTIKYHPVKELEDICRRKSYLYTFSKSHENGVASITAEVEADGAIYKETKTGKNKKEAKALAAEAMLKFLKDRHLSSLM
ncbi:hypothetical protein QJS04_geneDACA021027 [Acorus gramineus]|uniref:Uncharacterized protein n=1 Tax=Acorus gramineus TaxID=55184 RepID=A0AAV9B6J9_ACOGR|nr:hypothetical protein QJS04_geneDACA021027 [Acorus gramineus]